MKNFNINKKFQTLNIKQLMFTALLLLNFWLFDKLYDFIFNTKERDFMDSGHSCCLFNLKNMFIFIKIRLIKEYRKWLKSIVPYMAK